jgi:hypothetical protein
MSNTFNKPLQSKKSQKQTKKHNIKIESVESFIKRGGKIEVIVVGKKGRKSSKS